jgi:hypothetical protein
MKKPTPDKPMHPKLRNLNSLARLMDANFRIPNTSVRFGMDAIIGLIPGVGDLISLAISGYIMSTAAKLGASKYVMARMMLNTGVDAIIGAIPVIGDIFDVGFKANQRNLRLVNQHFNEGRHGGSATKVVVPVMIFLLLLLAGFIWLIYKLIVWIF